MSKKLVAGVVIGIGLLVGLSVMLVAELKHKYDTPIETEVEESENELVMPTSQNDDYETVGENQELVTIEGVTYAANLNDYIDVEKFAEAVGQYGRVTVTSYGGGIGGEFIVTIYTDSGEYTGVWDDPNGVWYESKDDYKGDVDAN